MLANFILEENVLLFPNDEILRLEALTSSKELLSERLFTLGEILYKKNKILIVPVSSLILPLPSPDLFLKNVKYIKVGDVINLDHFKYDLIKMGYEAVNKIDQSLQFASRGDILDIFPINYDTPLRIEFFGDEIESIRHFDIAHQESNIKEFEIKILPANEFLFSDLEFSKIKSKLIARGINPNLEHFDAIYNHRYSPSTLRYYLSLKDEVSSILDYFHSDLTLIINEDELANNIAQIKKDARDYLGELYMDNRLAYIDSIFLNLSDLHLEKLQHISTHKFSSDSSQMLFQVRPLQCSPNLSLNYLNVLVDSYLHSNNKVVFSLSNKTQIDTLKAILDSKEEKYEIVEELNLPQSKIGISFYPLSEGFELVKEKIIYVSSFELFSFHRRLSKYLSHFKEATILKSYEELNSGDYIVHEQYGIGKFLEVKTMNIEGNNRDFLYILYANNEHLYVPLEQFRLVRKYSGKEGNEPTLSSLHNEKWKQTKERIKRKVGEMADKLYALYNERFREIGYAFPIDDELQEMFEKEFPYDLTVDQAQALREIKDDLESGFVMDRLLCGDVGFGKTEVAFRAAFKVIMSHKQVAIMCPTIILARQHFLRARERFEHYGIRIALLTRNTSNKQLNQTLKDIEAGKINLIIATHKLLSNKLLFNDLGLLIIDEEQRFGVRQKEKLKLLKQNVDVLSLSATPIPRTLQLSLVGIRSISQINTAPSNRMPIQTYVLPYRLDIVLDLIKREMKRHGQVFYVLNNIDALYQRAHIIGDYLKDISLSLIHGKMDKNELEEIMNDFYDGKISVLFATSIIENGIDIPNVNLLIVEDADHYGLSQLYQIKGRVGRGSRIAYAYFMYNGYKDLSKDAIKQLKAIQEFTELGSGYKIAQRDLLIRGAGDILGEEQAGFIDMIGMDLYLKLLNEVIEEKKAGVRKEPVQSIPLFSLNAYVPSEYALESDKIEIYQDIVACETLEGLSQVRKKIRDIYGRLPEEVELLLRKRKIDILANNQPFKSLVDYRDYIEIQLTPAFSTLSGIGVVLFDALAIYLNDLRVLLVKKILIIKLFKKDKWLDKLEEILNIIIQLYKKYALNISN